MSHTHNLVEKVCRWCHLHNQKVHVNILFDCRNQIDDHIKFTMEHQDKEGSTSSLTQSAPHTPANLYKLQCIENPVILTDTCDWNSNHPISAKRSVVQTPMHRAKMVCSTPKVLGKKMDYLNKVLHLNSYPDWFLKILQHQHADQTPSQSSIHTGTECGI